MAKKKRRTSYPKQQKPQKRGGANVYLLIAAALLLLVFAALVFSGRGKSQAKGAVGSTLKIGGLAPALEVKSLDGKDIDLRDFRGHVVLVNFWATWCPPCRAEMPDLEQMYEDYKSKGFVILGVNAEPPQQIPVAKQFLAEHGITFLAAQDPMASVNNAYRIRGLPTSWLVNPEGIVVRVWTGRIQVQDARQAIEKLLQKSGQ